MTIEQIKLGFDNFSYLIHCPETREAALVDPGMDTARARQFIQQNNIKLKYIICLELRQPEEHCEYDEER